MTVNKYINKTEIELTGYIRRYEHIYIYIYIYIYAHESRDKIKQWSFDKIDVKAMQFPIPNVNIDI